MKKITITAIVTIVMALFISIPTVHAEDWREKCETLGNIAETLMEVRQQGVPMSNLMNEFRGVKLMEELVIEAYKTPRYSTPRIQKRVVQDFKNEVYMECVSAFRE